LQTNFSGADPDKNCKADFNFTVNESDKTIFKINRMGNQNWEWNFGEGLPASGQSPFYNYSTPGYYLVSLRVTNGKGCDEDL